MYHRSNVKFIADVLNEPSLTGLHAPNKDCKWRWEGSNKPFNPGTWFWMEKEPNGCDGVRKEEKYEFCAMNLRGKKKWNDSKCYYTNYFLCGNPGMLITHY